jgi:hypothetical protein
METMSRTFLVLIMLCVASASTAQPVRQSDARPSMLYFGTAMLDDGTLALHLRLTSDGKPVSDTLTYRVSDRAYDNVLRHPRRSPSRRNKAVQAVGRIERRQSYNQETHASL